MELVDAMEIFAIGHEYGHFVLEEGTGQIGDVPEEQRKHEEEHFADAIGYLLCRAYGVRHKNWPAFCGAATLLFFRSIELCESVRAQVADEDVSAPSASDSHPPTSDRIRRICELAELHTASDQRPAVAGYLAETALICDALQDAVTLMAKVLQEMPGDK
jgi:hypothetical protein